MSASSRLAMACAIGLMASAQAQAFDLTPSARLHLDHASHREDRKPLPDGWRLRRASVGLEGAFNEDWSFELGYDFTDGGEFKDVALAYGGWSQGAVAVGQSKVPFGLEELTSSNNLLLPERALPIAAFAPSRRVGIGFNRNRRHYTLAAMGYGASIGGDEGPGVAARFTLAPRQSDDGALHFGIAASRERAGDEVKFSARPEARVADVKLVNTGAIAHARRVDRTGLEAAWMSGPFLAQAEWVHASVVRGDGHADVRLHGWYVAGSWCPRGESRGYKNGRIKGVSTIGPRGSWELTARYSHLDLEDGAVQGGVEDNASLGVNYYVNRHLRIMADYIDVRSRRKGQSDDPDMVLLRAQLVF